MVLQPFLLVLPPILVKESLLLNNGAISIYFSLLFIVLHFDEKSIHTFILYPDILKNVISSISILCTNLVMGAFCIGYTIIRYRAFSKISTIIIQWIFGLFWMVAWFWVSEVVYSLFQVFSGVLSFGVPSCDYLRFTCALHSFCAPHCASFYTFLNRVQRSIDNF